MRRIEILDIAKELIDGERDVQHGDAEANFTLIATYWSAHLDTDVTASDVAVMMTLLKLARTKSGAMNADNWIDGCGYMALGGEINA